MHVDLTCIFAVLLRAASLRYNLTLSSQLSACNKYGPPSFAEVQCEGPSCELQGREGGGGVGPGEGESFLIA